MTRLENETESIYELISDMRVTQLAHGRRLDGIGRRFGGIDRRFDGIGQRFDGVDRRFDGMDGRFDTIDRRLDGMDGRLETIDSTLTEVLRRLPEPA